MLLRLFNEDVDLINHSNPNGAKSGEGSKGSIPAEGDALELQKRIESSTRDTLDDSQLNGEHPRAAHERRSYERYFSCDQRFGVSEK